MARTRLHSSQAQPGRGAPLHGLPARVSRRSAEVAGCARRAAVHPRQARPGRCPATAHQQGYRGDAQPAAHQEQRLLPIPREGARRRRRKLHRSPRGTRDTGHVKWLVPVVVPAPF